MGDLDQRKPARSSILRSSGSSTPSIAMGSHRAAHRPWHRRTIRRAGRPRGASLRYARAADLMAAAGREIMEVDFTFSR